MEHYLNQSYLYGWTFIMAVFVIVIWVLHKFSEGAEPRERKRDVIIFVGEIRIEYPHQDILQIFQNKDELILVLRDGRRVEYRGAAYQIVTTYE